MPHLALDKVSVHYDGQPEPAVERVSLDIGKGDFVVLVGRSGCGKTSLLNVAAGLVEPERAGPRSPAKSSPRPDRTAPSSSRTMRCFRG